MKRTGYVPLGKRCPHGLNVSVCPTCVSAAESARRLTFLRADPDALKASGPREYSEYVGGERVLQVVRRNKKNELS